MTDCLPSLTPKRRTVVAALGLLAGNAWSSTYPARAIRIVVPTVPGGPVDNAARLLAASLAEQLKRPVVVDNRVGASQTIGTRAVVRAEPDGYTVFFSTAFPQHPLFAPNGVAVGDVLRPVGNMLRTSLMLSVRNDLPVKTVAELISYAKSSPGKLNNAVSGASVQLLSALFSDRTGIRITDVPFQGESQAVVAVLSGTCDAAFMSPSITVPNARAERLRPLMSLGRERSPLAPDLPTAAESGIKDFTYSVNIGLWAPKATPAPIVERLNEALLSATRSTELIQRATGLGFEMAGSSPQEQLAIYQQEISVFGEAARIANYSPR